MNNYLQLLLILTIVLSTSCKEPYYPDIDETKKMLVVDGLLTDESNIIKVHISNAVPFRDQSYLPERSAIVVVGDDNGKKYTLIEKSPGYYESKDFKYEYGRTYTLVIKTKDNKCLIIR